jgi:predicted permease
MHDWRAEVRARLADARLLPDDETEIVEEVAQHLEQQYAELAPRIGASAARERLLEQLRDRAFDDAATRRRRRARPSSTVAWGSPTMLREIRFAIRSLKRSPGMVGAGVAALALGIGLTTTMFSIIYGLLIKGLPYADADRIAVIYRVDARGRGEEELVPFGDFVRYRAEQRSFARFGGYEQGLVNVSGQDRPEQMNAVHVSAGVLAVPGVAPLLGRVFAAGDYAPNAPPTAIISFATWRDRFAGDTAAIGTALRVNRRPYTIIGVMPEGYEFPRSAQLWLPLQLDTAAFAPGQGTPLTIVGRLEPGVPYERANAELAVLSKRLVAMGSDTTARRDLAQPFVRAMIPGRVYSLLYGMLGAVFLVLLVACANVANLLLDRATNRTREIGIRLALGASRMAVIRYSLVESSILALLAAVVGAGLAQLGITAFVRATANVGEAPPFWMDVRLHAPVLLFVLALAFVASLVSGVLPAIHSARLDINTILKDAAYAASSRRAGRSSRAIVVAQLALSSAMLLVAGFMTKSIAQLRTFDPRFRTAEVFTARVALAGSDTVAQRRLIEELERRLAAVPGMAGVYLGSGLPGSDWSGSALTVQGRQPARGRDRTVVRTLAVSPGFFATFGVPVLRGRAILPSDGLETPGVAVVSESFARRVFRDVDPIGKRIRLGEQSSNPPWLTIVGIVPSLYAANPTRASGDHFPPEVLTSFWQQRRMSSATVALRGPAAVANATTLRTSLAGLDPDLPISAAQSMADALNRPTWPVRVFGSMFVIFGTVSLVLAAIGLYAVMAFSVSRRVREMGIRMALGATAGDVVRLVCRQGLAQIVIGMSLGLLAGSALVRIARSMLFEVQPSDPSVFALVASVLGAAALLACLVPALRATRVDPLVALRSD